MPERGPSLGKMQEQVDAGRTLIIDGWRGRGVIDGRRRRNVNRALLDDDGPFLDDHRAPVRIAPAVMPAPMMAVIVPIVALAPPRFSRAPF